MKQQYHILVVGFELTKQNKSSSESRTTGLRHYRYDLDSHQVAAEGGAWIVKKGKEFISAFPVPHTMILVEDVKEESLS
jgi:hypothetical protein